MPSWQRLAEMVPANVALGNDPLLGLRKKICGIAPAPAKLLEVGCGSGLLAGWFQDFGYDVYALDNDSAVLVTARRRLAEEKIGQPAFFQGDAFRVAAGMRRFAPFDVCYSQGFLEHFSDAEIGELLAQQLAIANWVVFSVPSEHYPRREKEDERLLPLPYWYELMLKLEKEAEPTIAYYGRDSHLLGVLRKKQEGK